MAVGLLILVRVLALLARLPQMYVCVCPLFLLNTSFVHTVFVIIGLFVVAWPDGPSAIGSTWGPAGAGLGTVPWSHVDDLLVQSLVPCLDCRHHRSLRVRALCV